MINTLQTHCFHSTAQLSHDPALHNLPVANTIKKQSRRQQSRGGAQPLTEWWSANLVTAMVWSQVSVSWAYSFTAWVHGDQKYISQSLRQEGCKSTWERSGSLDIAQSAKLTLVFIVQSMHYWAIQSKLSTMQHLPSSVSSWRIYVLHATTHTTLTTCTLHTMNTLTYKLGMSTQH